MRPALVDIREAVDQVTSLRNKLAGRVRLLVPRLAATTVLAPRLGQLARDYPDIVLDVTTDDRRLDIVADGSDAGINLGEFIQKDMIAVRVSGDRRPVIVGSPAYFKSRSKPKSPRDLLNHRCINFRHGSDGVYRWEFEKGKKSLSVGVSSPLIVDDVAIVIRAAIDGVGLAFLTEEQALPLLADGSIVDTRPGRLVSAVHRLLPLLSESAPAAGRALSCDQRPSTVIDRESFRVVRCASSGTRTGVSTHNDCLGRCRSFTELMARLLLAEPTSWYG